MIPGKKAALAAAAAVVVTASSIGIASAANEDKARVIRVIDGDTLVVDFDRQELTVRLLNVDTPETKDPDQPVECLGPEATDFLQDALPEGSKVTLEFDVEREDSYGRTLAGVYDADDRLINAEIARRGLGIPVTYGRNTKFRPPVDEAYLEAQKQQSGLFAEDIECTVPAMVAALEETAAQAAAQETGATAAAAGAAVTAVYALAQAVDTGFDAYEAGARAGKSMIWAALPEKQAGALLDRAAAAKSKVHARADELTALQTERQSAEDEVQRKAAEAKAEAERIAAEEQARKAAEAAQAEANRQAAQQQYVPPAQSNPYPGYTGPRCYAPGGKTWRPC